MKKTTFLIVGKHAVVEALKNPKRKIEKVFLTEDAQKTLNRENQSLNLFKNIHVFYKSDLSNDESFHFESVGDETIYISCKTGKNLPELKESIKKIIFMDPAAKDPLLLEERHRYHFKRIQSALEKVIDLWNANAPDEIAAVEIDTALSHTGEITGKISTEEVLGRIFSMFCVGK